jgi:hypothetical protein
MPAARRPRILLAAVLPLLVAGLAACDGGQPQGQPSGTPPGPTSTPLTALDTAGLVVPRVSFCDRVAPVDAQRALGSEVASSSSYGNGDQTQLTARVRDVAHEFGCIWTAGDDTRARAWVFTPPVTLARARQLRRTAAGPGCRVLTAASAFGAPSVAVRCREPGGLVRTTFSGLFGDAWLSCELDVAGPRVAGLTDRTGRWCVTVARAASGTPG